MAAKKTTVEVTVYTLQDALDLASSLGVHFTDAEVDLAVRRVEQDAPLNVLETLLDERVGSGCRAQRDYPPLVAPAEPAAPTEDEVRF